MAFSTIFTVVIIGYILVYLGMIVYDLFFKKSPADLLPKIEDEVIDISDEAGSFKPKVVGKAARRYRNKNKIPSHEDDDPDDDNGSNGNGEVETNAEEPQQSKPEQTDKESHPHFDDDQPSNRKPLEEKDTEKEKVQSVKAPAYSKVSDTQNQEPPNESDAQEPSSQVHNGNTNAGAQQDKVQLADFQHTVHNKFKTRSEELPKADFTSKPKKELAKGLDFINEDLPYVRISDDDLEAKTRIAGAIKVEDLVKDANEIAEKGSDSHLAKILAKWDVYELDLAKQEAEKFMEQNDESTNTGHPPKPKVML